MERFPGAPDGGDERGPAFRLAREKDKAMEVVMALDKIHPTTLLSRYVSRLQYTDLPADVVAYAKLLILDQLASAMAGYKVNRVFNRAVLEVIGGMGGKPESTVLFGGGRIPAAHAAFINAVYGHGADLDDGNRIATGHPGVAIIPAVLSLAEAHGLGGKEAITAIVAGYDVYVRLGTLMMPAHFLKGFHSTGTIGAVAAGAASARVLGLAEDGVRRAISLAAVQASGLHEVSDSGQMAKPINPGNAARTGILSALLAKAGADAPRDPLEGDKGFLKAFADGPDWATLPDDLGRQFKIATCYIKLYPACRHAHAPIDAALRLREAGIAGPAAIETITIHTYPSAIAIAGNIFEPKNEDEAKLSITFATATALATGRFTLADLKNAAQMSGEVKALIGKMRIVSDPALNDKEAGIRGARIDVVFKDGTDRSETVPLPKGDPEVPLQGNDMTEKLRSCASELLGEEAQRELYDAAMGLEDLARVSSLMEIVSKIP
ncbi:MAG: MmgE/PrpD family protein [Deltaproteobacteria bacterium]|nr:MmgE/PrpD family protein [Deltaproteobacteria bacterium]